MRYAVVGGDRRSVLLAEQLQRDESRREADELIKAGCVTVNGDCLSKKAPTRTMRQATTLTVSWKRMNR